MAVGTIERVKAYGLVNRLKRPLRLSGRTVVERETLVVCVWEVGGLMGVGEAAIAPYFTGETLEGACHVVREVIGPVLAGMKVQEIQKICRRIADVLPRNESAKAAVEMAVHDLLGKVLGVPACYVLGGKAREMVEGVWHVSAPDLGEAEAEAAEGVRLGFRTFKLKVGGVAFGVDLARVRAVRDAIGSEAVLQIDVNEGWRGSDALEMVRALGEYGVQFVEQPVPREDRKGLELVSRRSPIPIALDEGAFKSSDVFEQMRGCAGNGVIVKVMKSGGIREAYTMGVVAEAARLCVHVASMPGEGSIGAAGAIHLAASLPELKWGAGIAAHMVAEDIVVKRLEPEGGLYRIPPGPGLGVDVEEAHIRERGVRFE